MANKAIASINVEVLPDDMRFNIVGENNFDIVNEITASSGDGWVYGTKPISTSSIDLIEATDDYIKTDFDGVVNTSDKIPWIAIKHTGTKEGYSPTNNGLCIAPNETAAHTLTNGIYLEPGELIILKLPNCTVADLHCITVTMSNGKPTAVGSTDVYVKFAAILQNVG